MTNEEKFNLAIQNSEVEKLFLGIAPYNIEFHEFVPANEPADFGQIINYVKNSDSNLQTEFINFLESINITSDIYTKYIFFEYVYSLELKEALGINTIPISDIMEQNKKEILSRCEAELQRYSEWEAASSNLYELVLDRAQSLEKRKEEGFKIVF